MAVAARAVTAALAVWAAVIAPACVSAAPPLSSSSSSSSSSSAMTEERELRQEGGLRMLAVPDVPTNVQAMPDINTMSQSLPLMRVTWQPPAGGPTALGYKVRKKEEGPFSRNPSAPFLPP
jgi:hypothetical protein